LIPLLPLSVVWIGQVVWQTLCIFWCDCIIYNQERKIRIT